MDYEFGEPSFDLTGASLPCLIRIISLRHALFGSNPDEIAARCFDTRCKATLVSFAVNDAQEEKRGGALHPAL